MQELEKILEEIEGEENKVLSRLQVEVSQRSIDEIREYVNGIRYEKDIIRKHMNDGWIPVGERLPGKHVRYVWITVDHGTIQQRILAKWGGEKFRSIYGGEFCGRIVAWKECDVPEPYRPERSE